MSKLKGDQMNQFSLELSPSFPGNDRHYKCLRKLIETFFKFADPLAATQRGAVTSQWSLLRGRMKAATSDNIWHAIMRNPLQSGYILLLREGACSKAIAME
jgi:hypothetical protein